MKILLYYTCLINIQGHAVNIIYMTNFAIVIEKFFESRCLIVMISLWSLWAYSG